MAQVEFPFDASTYDYARSTEENYASDTAGFHGDFVDIRAHLDWRWHRNYSRERQLFQDQLVRNCVRRTLRQ
eukprot:2749666-Pyramimonas_sp.AAC.1